jgi:chromosome segregation ATPase
VRRQSDVRPQSGSGDDDDGNEQPGVSKDQPPGRMSSFLSMFRRDGGKTAEQAKDPPPEGVPETRRGILSRIWPPRAPPAERESLRLNPFVGYGNPQSQGEFEQQMQALEEREKSLEREKAEFDKEKEEEGDLKVQITQQKQKLKNLKRDIKFTNNELIERNAEKKSMEDRIAELTPLIEQIDKDYEEAEIEWQEQSEIIDKDKKVLNAEKGKLEQETNAATRNLKALQSQIQQLQKQTRQNRTAWDAEKERLLADLERTRGGIASQIEEEQALQNSINQKNRDLNDLTAEHERTKKEFRKEISELEEEKTTLTNLLDSKRAEIEGLRQEKENLERQKETLENDIAGLERNKKSLEEENTKLGEEISGKEDEKQKLEGELSGLRNAIRYETNRRQQEVEALTALIASKTSEIGELDTNAASIRALEEKLQKKEGKIGALNDANERLESLMRALQSAKDDLDKKYKAEVAGLTTSNEGLNRLMKERSDQIARQNTEISRLTKEVYDLRALLASKTSEIRELDTNAAPIRALEEKLQKKEEEIGTLKLANSELKTSMKALQSAKIKLNSKHMAEVADLTASNKALQQFMEEQSDQIARQNTEISRLEEEVEEQTVEIGNLEQLNSDFKKQVDDLSLQNYDLEQLHTKLAKISRLPWIASIFPLFCILKYKIKKDNDDDLLSDFVKIFNGLTEEQTKDGYTVIARAFNVLEFDPDQQEDVRTSKLYEKWIENFDNYNFEALRKREEREERV